MIMVPYVRTEHDRIREMYSEMLGVPVERIIVKEDANGLVHVTVSPEVPVQFIRFDVNVDIDSTL